ncbi:MAG: ABC transporter ATP-binding protein, partial [Candidatus Hydrogenedentes bacterium]|nr:ABC transporter ATP-binding protein [Candidatus Hydrogenedentota bacterium]
MSTNGETLVRVSNVEKSFRRGSEDIHVLSGMTFEVPQGDFVALMGP